VQTHARNPAHRRPFPDGVPAPPLGQAHRHRRHVHRPGRRRHRGRAAGRRGRDRPGADRREHHRSGNFAVATVNISSSVSGFGGGIAYYPNTTGTFPVIAMSPGFTAAWSSISWLGPRVASWGFVVVGIETNSRFDQPTSRGSQLIAALNWAVNSSPTAVRSRVDGSRRGVAGHSMGGGGTLSALSRQDGSLIKAGVPLAPWNQDKTWSEVTEAVMIVGGSADSTAPDAQHSIPFYNSLGGQKGFVEIAGAGHLFPTSQNAIVSRAMVSWFKRFLNNDARFTPFTCGFGSVGGISQFRTNAC
jgi:dienelactone hydrolase